MGDYLTIGDVVDILKFAPRDKTALVAIENAGTLEFLPVVDIKFVVDPELPADTPYTNTTIRPTVLIQKSTADHGDEELINLLETTLKKLKKSFTCSQCGKTIYVQAEIYDKTYRDQTQCLSCRQTAK